MMQTDIETHEQVKEVFAYFGRACYAMSCFETGLAIALLQLDFMTRVKEEFKRDGGRGFDRKRYEAEFDSFMSNQHAQTLGNLIKRVEGLTALDEHLKERIRDAKKRREFLSHHYFRERAQEFAGMNGRNKMIAELEESHDFFEAIDRDFRDVLRPVREGLGMKDELLLAHFRNIKRRAEEVDTKRESQRS